MGSIQICFFWGGGMTQGPKTRPKCIGMKCQSTDGRSLGRVWGWGGYDPPKFVTFYVVQICKFWCFFGVAYLGQPCQAKILKGWKDTLPRVYFHHGNKQHKEQSNLTQVCRDILLFDALLNTDSPMQIDNRQIDNEEATELVTFLNVTQ